MELRAQAWGPLVSLSRTAMLSLFKSIELGRLAIYDGDSEEALAICGNPKAQAAYPVTFLRVHDEKFRFRLVVYQLLYISIFGMLRQSCLIATALERKLRRPKLRKWYMFRCGYCFWSHHDCSLKHI